MKKLAFNLGFAALAVGLLTLNAQATVTGSRGAPDTAATSLLLSLGVAGLAAVRKFVR
jgi:hypothetical protein